jgi:hypothetical protein
MSWTAYLTDDRGHDEGTWNYTHNCNHMADTVLDATGASCFTSDTGQIVFATWWKVLDGKTGPEGAALLDEIIRGFAADPDGFRTLNPDNGWGDYDSFLKILIEMRNAVPEWPTVWSVNG